MTQTLLISNIIFLFFFYFEVVLPVVLLNTRV